MLTAVISAAGSNEVDINATVTGSVQRSVLRIWDVAAPTVILQTTLTTTSTTPSLSYVSAIVGHTYQGDVQSFNGPFASTVKLTGTVVAT